MRIGDRRRLWRETKTQVKASGRIYMLGSGREFKAPLGHRLETATASVAGVWSDGHAVGCAAPRPIAGPDGEPVVALLVIVLREAARAPIRSCTCRRA